MTRAKNWLIIVLVWVISTLALWLPSGMSKVYENFDGPYYLVVARTWYNQTLIRNNFSFPLPLEYYPAHFPLYPALIDVFRTMGVNGPRSMVLVNLLASAILGVVFYEIAKKMDLKNPLLLSILLGFFWPRMWVVRSVGSPETLFILFVLLSLFSFQKGKYWWAGITGALAVLTKSPGILLFVAYGILFLKKPNVKMWPVLLIPASLLLLFTSYSRLTGDFLAYFHSGDNIHLQLLPFRVFDSTQAWVGDWWLEEVIWLYIVGGIGVWRALKKNTVWGTFGAIFYATILFVSHRDLGRYALPLVPVVLLGFEDLLSHKEVRWMLLLAIIPLYFFSLNFLAHNTVSIADWSPFL